MIAAKMALACGLIAAAVVFAAPLVWLWLKPDSGGSICVPISGRVLGLTIWGFLGLLVGLGAGAVCLVVAYLLAHFVPYGQWLAPTSSVVIVLVVFSSMRPDPNAAEKKKLAQAQAESSALDAVAAGDLTPLHQPGRLGRAVLRERLKHIQTVDDSELLAIARYLLYPHTSATVTGWDNARQHVAAQLHQRGLWVHVLGTEEAALFLGLFKDKSNRIVLGDLNEDELRAIVAVGHRVAEHDGREGERGRRAWIHGRVQLGEIEPPTLTEALTIARACDDPSLLGVVLGAIASPRLAMDPPSIAAAREIAAALRAWRPDGKLYAHEHRGIHRFEKRYGKEQ